MKLLTDDEQKAILALGTGKQLDYDKSETIVDLFHRQAILTPDNIAVVDEVSEITYAELDRRSNLLATALIKAGVSTDTFVAIMLPRRKEFLVAVFAVFKAGGAYTCLYPERFGCTPVDHHQQFVEGLSDRAILSKREAVAHR